MASPHFYAAALPEEDDLVVGRVTDVTDTHVVMELPEYGDREAIMLLRDIKRGWMRSVHNHLKMNAEDVFQVTLVDAGKGYINVSKKAVTDEDRDAAMARYRRACTVNTILRSVALKASDAQPGTTLEALYRTVVWPLSEDAEEGDGGLGALEAVARGEPVLDRLGLDDGVAELVKRVVAERLAPPEVRVFAEINVMCFSRAGIDGIQDALGAAALDGAVGVHLKAAPVFTLSLTTADVPAGKATLARAITACEERIRHHGGLCVVQTPPGVEDEHDAPARPAQDDSEVYEIGQKECLVRLPAEACRAAVQWQAAAAERPCDAQAQQ